MKILDKNEIDKIWNNNKWLHKAYKERITAEK